MRRLGRHVLYIFRQPNTLDESCHDESTSQHRFTDSTVLCIIPCLLLLYWADILRNFVLEGWGKEVATEASLPHQHPYRVSPLRESQAAYLQRHLMQDPTVRRIRNLSPFASITECARFQ